MGSSRGPSVKPVRNDDLLASWLASLERSHLGDLTISEVARALRALSSCYVERRSRLAEGGALETRGKRAAFALFYGPMHFLVTREVLSALPSALASIDDIVDLGCGTGAAGAAWAIYSGARAIRGYDRHPWAIHEANATYRHFRLEGRAQQRDITKPSAPPLRIRAGAGLIAAYTANELSAEGRSFMLSELLSARERGARVIVIEPIARRSAPWWEGWRSSFEAAGGRADEWRFRIDLPPTQQLLARSAGLAPQELTARSLFL
jgi:hypothetical protein